MKKIAYTVLCFLMLVFMTACGNSGKTKGLDKLVIVVEKGVHKHITEQLKDMIAEVEEETGIEIPLETSGKYDYVKGTTEILIGDTDREISSAAYKSLPKRGYVMQYAEGALVIAGTNDAMLSYAIQEFYALCIDGGVDISGLKKISQDSSEKEIVTIVENKQTTYSVAVPEESDVAMTKSEYNNGIDIEVNCMNEVIKLVDEYIRGSMENTTYSSKNEARYEILIGDTGSNEFAEAKKNWQVNEYGVQCIGNKILVGGWSKMTTSLAGELFIDLLKMGTIKEESGAEAIYFIKDHFAHCSVDTWITDIPSYEGGTLSSTHETAQEQLMWYITDTSTGAFGDYCKTLEKEGYELVLSNENVGNLYRTFVKGDVKIHTYYTAYDKTVRIVSGNQKEVGMVKDDVTSDEKVTDFSVYQLPLTYEFGSAGMCYVITLEDGRFVIIDSGNDSKEDAARLYEVLKRANKRDDGIVIAGWFITHEHGDHIFLFERFMEYYGDRVTLKTMYSNLPSASGSFNSQAPDVSTLLRIPEEAGGVPVTCVHTGQKFMIGNAEFEILFTTEDLYPDLPDNFNDTSTVFRVTTKDGSILFPGDAYWQASDILIARYGDYLKSDVIQVAHHGWNGLKWEVYELVQPKLAFWPNSSKALGDAFTGYNQKLLHREVNRKLLEIVGIENIYVADECVWQLNLKEMKCTEFMPENDY